MYVCVCVCVCIQICKLIDVHRFFFNEFRKLIDLKISLRNSNPEGRMSYPGKGRNISITVFSTIVKTSFFFLFWLVGDTNRAYLGQLSRLEEILINSNFFHLVSTPFCVWVSPIQASKAYLYSNLMTDIGQYFYANFFQDVFDYICTYPTSNKWQRHDAQDIIFNTCPQLSPITFIGRLVCW